MIHKKTHMKNKKQNKKTKKANKTILQFLLLSVKLKITEYTVYKDRVKYL